MVTGAVLHTHTYGAEAAAPAVVALHGIRGHGARWRSLTEQHLPGIRVHGLDLRGHGRSTWSPPWTLEQHAADVLTTMDELGLGRADVIGHSFGGAVALYVARYAPDRVRRLVLLDPAIGLPTTVASDGARDNLVRQSFDDQGQARVAQAVHWPDSVGQPAVDTEVEEHLEQGEDGRWRWRFEPATVVTAYSEMARPHVVPPPGLPTLLVRAAVDPVVPAGFIAACRAARGADVTVTDVDCGHLVYLERPAETAALTRKFLDR
ncbi:MAG TPA: alpha/beta hydrolase [Micromonosporaceae bacterium]|nr:alpha/beta hydrolase [Micromonosporaceae bacterium]